ncbi:phage antirepressor KilAC domain-containing protein [Ruminococcus sp.]|uniref:phage antirepressor KilAC domain-containing protein n=1 Tax=Ruminococcus sp. TaxID=41978 RepID=UPI003966D152
MNNMIKIFENEEFGSLRILKEDNGRIMFCGKDVASALGYSNTKDAIRRHCRWGVKHDLPHPQSPARTIEMVFIPEGDVYRLISHSRLPSAEKFESWIFDEVLPTIRRTGGYVASEDMFIENYLPFLDEPYRDLFRLQMTAIEKLNERIRHDQPLVEFANQVAGTDNLIDMNAMAKLARAENISVGRNKLYSWLKRTGVLMSNNLPYQRYIDRGYFAVKESVFEVNGLKKTYRQTFVTGKGQLFIISLLRKYYGKEMS